MIHIFWALVVVWAVLRLDGTARELAKAFYKLKAAELLAETKSKETV